MPHFMPMNPALIALAATVLYALASWQLTRTSVEERGGLPLWFGLLAMVLHAATHGLKASSDQALPMHFFPVLSLVTLGMAAVSTAVAWKRRFTALGSLVYALAGLALLVFALTPHTAPHLALAWPLKLHAWLALLAYAVLAVGAALALLLWWQDRLLRARRLAHPLLAQLPPLTELETLLFRVLTVGFLLLTLALALGAVFVEDLFGQHLAHKTVLSVLSWCVFAILLAGRLRYGWRGRRAIRLTLTAMALLLLAFFGSKFVLELVLRRV